MPYIKQENRDKFETILKRVNGCFLSKGVTPGDLNYLITSICKNYIERKGLNYTHLNDIIGVLESAKQEFYRRDVTPYEDEKINENGDL